MISHLSNCKTLDFCGPQQAMLSAGLGAERKPNLPACVSAFSAMNGRVIKARTRHSRATPSKTAQAKLLDAAADKGAELPRSHREPSLDGGLAQDTTPVQAAKRQLDATSESDPLPAKRARLTPTSTQQPRVEGAEQVDKTTGQDPKPKPKHLKRRDTSPPDPSVERQEQVPPATQLQKWQLDSDGDNDKRQLKRTRLTRKNLARFNKMGKRKASKNASASAHLESTVDSSSAKTISTTTSGFAIQAYKNGILEPLYSKPPTNLGDIRKRHTRSRATASPPESEYKRYARAVGGAFNEATMVVEVSGKLLKEYDDDGYKRVFNQAFTGFPNDVGFNNSLSAPQPDFAEGLEMQQYDPFPVDENIRGAVLYKDSPGSLTLPHLAGEWKGRGKDMEEARLQSAYDGAALVYARNQALSYLGKPDPPGHAEVTTFTTDGTNLNFFAHYATPSGNNGALKYHQYQYASANVKDTYQGHKDGYKGIRNEQDYARDQSCALRDQLTEHWKQRRGGLQPIAEGAPLPGAGGTFKETNGDEDKDEADYEVVQQPCQPTPAASSQSLRALSSVSSKSLLPTTDYVSGSGGRQKRKASSPSASSHESSRQKSRENSYWQRDAKGGFLFHRHSDGRITWAKEDDRQ
ncbi:hypothetical protein TOPH_03830 [Tolypocladium ophioglossoides CBS 100239]|uniref:Uncharacterized protein n=1 Tax=Tolypocladium ophioglossoides (strain CBS 100239) TaxID=1163406 RepID=A0A0L0NCK5_TOLOC|nr:hypothetical protein TOPH_03830 [Tolypocladium ophioglossoides CBS 100239]